MSCFDSIYVKCPNCGKKLEFQSKSGDCSMNEYWLSEVVANQDQAIWGIIGDKVKCDCGAVVSVDVKFRAKPVICSDEDDEDNIKSRIDEDGYYI